MRNIVQIGADKAYANFDFNVDDVDFGPEEATIAPKPIQLPPPKIPIETHSAPKPTTPQIPN